MVCHDRLGKDRIRGPSTVLGTQDNMTTYRYNGYKHTSLEAIPIYLLYNISTICAIYM